jgi:hypothetical protein
MENWNPTVVYQMATARHNDIIARGEAAQQLVSPTCGLPALIWLANILAMLLTRRPKSAPAARPASEASAASAL